MSTDETVALLSGDNETILELDNEILPVTNVTDEGYDVTYVLPNNSSIFEVNATTEIDSFYFYETEQFTLLWFLFTVIVVGNVSVLMGLLLGKRRKSRMDFFIKQLAIAGNIACKLIKFLQVVVTYSSTYVLVALSIDRYDAITRPMNFSGSWWRARALVATAWGLSVAFSIPIIFLYEEKLIQEKKQCWIDLGSPVNWQIYMSLVSFTLFIAPTIIICGCYLVIVTTIWTQSSALRQSPMRDDRRASSRGLIPRAKIKSVKMTFVIVFVFVLCWSPYIVFDLLQVYGYVPKTQTNIAVATFIQSLAPLNSAANPIIYCLFSTPFCKNVRNMQAISWVSGRCCTCSHNCFSASNIRRRATRTTTVTTSLTAHSSRRSGHIPILHTASKKHVMVSFV
ncbi:crustacean cardioactive peptide receptor isoform X2 [Cotesia typhae]|uniref:crustacean cardioactive peptide receptor isoform X2 n=1 Tax=Cotesia typhae TaxID=2053667 RepID=UPI003D683CBA